MNQGYKLQTGNMKYGGQSLFKELESGFNQRAFGKIKPAQTYLFKEQIRNELLKNSSITDLQHVFSLMELVYLDNQEYIYQPGDQVRYLYFPESAVISEFQILDDGKTVEVAMTGREGIVGVTSVFNPNHSLNWSQVLIPGKALRIDARLLRQKLDYCAAFQMTLLEFINSYISQISQRVICNNHHTVEERLCLWFLMIYDRCGIDSLSLTHEQIARFLGVHRPSISLITQSMREKGIIDYLRGKIFILDKQKLKNTSCSCYSAINKHRNVF